MQSIFLSAGSSNKKVVLDCFSYLINMGYSLSSETINNVIERYCFTHESGDFIRIDFDIRERYVNLLVILNASVLIKLDYELQYYSGLTVNAREMIRLVQARYEYYKAKKRNSLSPMFKEIVKIYSDYLRPVYVKSH